MVCKNCQAEIDAKFCSNCGQPMHLERINGHYIVHEIQHVLHFERGILFTIRELVTNPGQNVRNYLTENRSRLVKPIIFVIITSLIYSLCVNIFHIEQNYVDIKGSENGATVKIFQWIQSHYGYANLIMAIFIAAWLVLFFRKSRFNFFEIMILLCFTMGIGMLIYAVFAIVQGLIGINLVFIGGLVGTYYCVWAIGTFYGGRGVMKFLKAFFAYIMGMISFTFLAIMLGLLIERFLVK